MHTKRKRETPKRVSNGFWYTFLMYSFVRNRIEFFCCFLCRYHNNVQQRQEQQQKMDEKWAFIFIVIQMILFEIVFFRYFFRHKACKSTGHDIGYFCWFFEMVVLCLSRKSVCFSSAAELNKAIKMWRLVSKICGRLINRRQSDAIDSGSVENKGICASAFVNSHKP